ncbi:heterokaryon incompatibility protein-domain-containing protein [Annulohypoxylon bovei var. microspora]|nr:heterokaryon incompatibility protein-domain-containing protein [Annulohypoxylon bovei var. microspora]
MASSHEDLEDMDCSLLDISARRPNIKITTQLLEIQSAQILHRKSLEFAENLECLYFCENKFTENRNLGRCNINAVKNRHYIALSYTWIPSCIETDVQTGKYKVQDRDSGNSEPSLVRNTVFRRIKRYMDHVHVPYLWIDQHCIEQREGEAKEIGMNAMDHNIRLLSRILKGSLVQESGGKFRLSKETSSDQALWAVKLLGDITSDTWFSRGWTFQENYRAGQEMTLLIPIMGFLPGELCVNSVNLHEEATKLCLACQCHQPPLSSDLCDRILEKVGRYKILLQPGNKLASKAMTPKIIADLAVRDLKIAWDRLPITANCCQYFVRLDRVKLRENKQNLSLSMIVLCLLNGEIFLNQPQNEENVVNMRKLPIPKFLEKQFFDRLQPPSPVAPLTFNKGCRFANVKLTEEGIQTEGHLWRSKCFISTEYFRRGSKRFDDTDSRDNLSNHELWRLKQLARKLDKVRERYLVKTLRGYIKDVSSPSRRTTSSQIWQDNMASMVATAIDQGKMLCIAYSSGKGLTGNAVFIVEHMGDKELQNLTQPIHIFTSFRPQRANVGDYDHNDIDKYVSIEVEPVAGHRNLKLPKLFTTGRWIYGLCFFKGCPLQLVVFPWPDTLKC